MARKGGVRRSTRALYSKNIKSKGKISIKNYLSTYKEGDRVSINLEPSILKGQSHTRFVGKSGKVVGLQGECVVVEIKDFDKTKRLVVHPVHLRRAK